MSWFGDVGDALTGINAGMQDTGKTFQTFNSVVAGQQLNDLNAINLRNQSMLQDAHEGNGANDYYNLLGYSVPVAQGGLARDTANNQDDQITAAMGARQGMRSQDFTQGGKYAVGTDEYNSAVNDYLSKRDPTLALQTYGALGIPGLQQQGQQNDLAVQYLIENMNSPKTKQALGIDADTDIDVVRGQDGKMFAVGKDGEDVPIPNSYQIAAQTLEQSKGTAAGFNGLTGEAKGLLALQGGGFGQGGAAGATGAAAKAPAKVPNDDELQRLSSTLEKAQKNYTDMVKATSGMDKDERTQYMQEAARQQQLAQANYDEGLKRRRAASAGAATGTFGPNGQFKARDSFNGVFGLPSQGGMTNDGTSGRPRQLAGRTSGAGTALAMGAPAAQAGQGFDPSFDPWGSTPVPLEAQMMQPAQYPDAFGGVQTQLQAQPAYYRGGPNGGSQQSLMDLINQLTRRQQGTYRGGPRG